ncbi:hypothetical protein G6F59_016306 [Rhizopus arrhizus]|nr:hypothetical protein G6F59_016306 [Rhizopus arrhizus]
MPGPLSCTSKQTPPPFSSRRTARPTWPRSVNLIALPSRLSRIWRTRISSPLTLTGPGGSSPRWKSSLRCLAIGCISTCTWSSRPARSNGRRSSSSRPASMRARSSASLTSRNRWLPACWIEPA